MWEYTHGFSVVIKGRQNSVSKILSKLDFVDDSDETLMKDILSQFYKPGMEAEAYKL